MVPILRLLPAIARGSSPADASDEEARRVEVIDRAECSVVVVLVERLTITHSGKQLSLQPSESLGTGIVVSRGDVVVTATHVVAEAGRVQV